MDIGVPRTLHEPVGREVEVELGQVVPHGLGDGDESEDHRQVGLHCWAHARAGALHTDPPVEVVAQSRHQEHQGPVDHELLERQCEDEVGDVPVELWVSSGKGRAVAEQQPVLPLAECLGADDQGQHDHDSGPQPTGVWPDDLAVALDELVFCVHRRALGGEPLGDDEADQQEDGEDCTEDEHEAGLDLEELDPDRVQRDGGEPERIGIEDGEGVEEHQDDDQKDRSDDDGATAAVARRLGRRG